MGVGNHVSREFNLLYRFHGVLSENDEKWTINFLQKMFPAKDVHKLSREELFGGLGAWMSNMPADPLHRPFHSLTRNKDGRFDDKDLVAILKAAIDDPAGMNSSKMPPVSED